MSRRSYSIPAQRPSFSLISFGFAVAILSTETAAQSVAVIGLVKEDVDLGRETSCRVDRRQSSHPKDSLYVIVYEKATFDSVAKVHAALRVQRSGDTAWTIAQNRGRDSVELEAKALSGRTVRVRRLDSNKDLCADVPVPLPELTGVTAARRTDFFAEGAISNALRSGAANGSASGALGVAHRDIKPSGQNRRYTIIPSLPIWWRGRTKGWLRTPEKTLPMKGEEFRAAINVASSVTELVASSQSVFRRALLAPSLSSSGALGAGTLEYHPFSPLFEGSHGPRLAVTFARVNWRFVRRLSTTTADTISDNLTIGSIDARWRWTFLEQIRDADGNDFAVNFEFGYTMRWLAGDGASDKDFKTRTLGTNKTAFHGAAGAMTIRLRQITAIADLPYLITGSGPLKGIRGLQPLISVVVTAPLFTFPGQPRSQ